MRPEIWAALRLTVTLASITTVVLLPVGTALALWLAGSQSKAKDYVAAIVTMPLVLPPTVLGFYLLLGFGPFGPGGLLASTWGSRTLAFSFFGLVVASAIYSLPFMTQPLRIAFQSVGRDTIEAASTLGASPLQTFARVVAPLSVRGYLVAAVMTFAHTVGEFGVVLMIGGSIPGQTRVLSIELFSLVEQGAWTEAGAVAVTMAGFSLGALLLISAAPKLAGSIWPRSGGQRDDNAHRLAGYRFSGRPKSR